MADPETLLTRKRRGPAPTGKGTLVGVRLQPGILAALDRWVATQPAGSLTSRPEAIRFALRDWLIDQGVLSLPADDDE